MTAPELDRDTLEELVGPAAWAYHQTLPGAEQVDVDRSWRVHGNVLRVAAAVLRTACTSARRQAAAAGADLKRFKAESGMEVEFQAHTSASAGDAQEWCLAAGRLTAQADATDRRLSRPPSVVFQPELQ